MSYYEKYSFDVHGFQFIKSGCCVCLKCGLKILEIIGIGDREVDVDKDEITELKGEMVTGGNPVLKCDFCGEMIS